MVQNIKVDIIYYKIPTDFEMEFNLSGCCRMRLLTDKAPDKKILVNQMSRAVSRSKVIIITGALFGNDGIIHTCAKAIGRPLVKADNKKFAMETDETIDIIENSLPLVTKDGVFGGCIVEQGPQTLILISENKDIRKKLMKNLIHPYINEISVDNSKALEKAEEERVIIPPAAAPIGDAVEVAIEPEIVASEEIAEDLQEPEMEEIAQEPEETLEEAISEEEIQAAGDTELLAEEDEEYLENAIIASEKAINETITDGQELVLGIDEFNRRTSQKAIEESDDLEEDDDYFFDEDDNIRPPLALRLNVPIIIVALILLVIVGILAYYIFLVPKMSGVSPIAYLRSIIKIIFG